MMPFIYGVLVAVLATSLHSRDVTAASSLSIQSQVAFTNQRACVKNCLYCGEYWEINCPVRPLADVIGCYGDQVDACYCETNLQSTVSSYITACVYSACNNDLAHVSSGISLYNGYCRVGTWTLNNLPGLNTGSSGAPTPAAAVAPLSIQSQPAFTDQRACVKDCLYCGQYWEINCPVKPLADVLGCYADQVDACYCETNLQSSASSHITACIYSNCNSDIALVSSGVSLYNGYCRFGTWSLNNYPTPSADTLTTTIPMPGSSPTSHGPSTTVSGSLRRNSYTYSSPGTAGTAPTTNPSGTGGPGDGDGGGGGLSKGSLIAVIVSVTCSVLGLVFGIVWKVWWDTRKRNRKI